MRRRLRVAGTVAAATALLVPVASVGPAAAVILAGAAGEEAAALRLLERAAVAGERVAYTGVQFVTAWGPVGTTSLLADVEHVPGRGTLVRGRGGAGRPGSPAAGAAEGPAWGTARGSAGDTAGDVAGDVGGDTAFRARPGRDGSLVPTPVALLGRTYDVTRAAPERVAGRVADVVEARWPSGGVAGRFWADRTSGLVLRQETYDRSGTAVRASAFLDIRIGPLPAALGHLPPMLPEAWDDRVQEAELADLRARGWTCPKRLPAELRLVEARQASDKRGPILHLGYSDGLSTVSVFQQRGRLAPTTLAGYTRHEVDGEPVYARDGVPQQLTWAARGRVFTVLADAPPETVTAVVRALPHGEPAAGSGLVERLRRGLGRLGSWLNPFG